ncbi:MAG TPA: hypothetical protein PLD62_06880, partial [Candidatus Cloacimonadota bacterium]|nr:hypothetical protein [Candidatus Cloacimonadota bacterium]
KIPILTDSLGKIKIIIYITKQILNRKEKQLNTKSHENQIDLMVYKLYELTYEEAKIVDPELDKVLAEFGLSKADFERMGVEELAKLVPVKELEKSC